MKHSILVVDDNAAVVEPMSEYLQNAGYDVRHAYSAAEAKGSLGAKNYSLVITDLKLETGRDEDGLGFIRHLHDSNPGLPVFVLTASGLPESAAEGIRLNVSKFLGKPISMARLLSTVQEFVEEFYGATPAPHSR